MFDSINTNAFEGLTATAHNAFDSVTFAPVEIKSIGGGWKIYAQVIQYQDRRWDAEKNFWDNGTPWYSPKVFVSKPDVMGRIEMGKAGERHLWDAYSQDEHFKYLTLTQGSFGSFVCRLMGWLATDAAKDACSKFDGALAILIEA
jgi:hypothetical protein